MISAGAQQRKLVQAWPLIPLGFVVGTIIYLAIYVCHRVGHGGHLGDFHHFYAAAENMLLGLSPYDAVAPESNRPGYIYPPLLAFLYCPFARFGDVVAGARIDVFLNLAALFGGLWIAVRTMLDRFGFDPREMRVHAATILGVVIVTLLSFDKIKGEIQMLQTNALLLLAFAVALHYLDRRPMITGAALGFAMNIKYLALIMLPYLLFRRRWKAAGWMAVWTLIWGMLPALLVGWGTELRYLAVAFRGILRLVGIDVGGAPTADVEGLSNGLSISIPSAIARMYAANEHLHALWTAAAIGLIWASVVAVLYFIRKVPLVLWPSAKEQQAAPYRQWIAFEWTAMIATTLCFSPQTNTRHLVLTALVTAGAIAFIIAKRRLSWTVILGVLILWAGLTFPPGRVQTTLVASEDGSGALMRVDDRPSAVRYWHAVGGPSWAVLLAMTLIAWGCMEYKIKSKLPKEMDPSRDRQGAIV